eukprot:m.354072 g.354072  ORF g.354072 m.354072 type:complete len:50 (+) comp70263_c0_seq1:50-199(+)
MLLTSTVGILKYLFETVRGYRSRTASAQEGRRCATIYSNFRLFLKALLS